MYVICQFANTIAPNTPPWLHFGPELIPLHGATQVEAVTVDTGAKSTFFCSGGGGDGETESDLYLTAAYELKLSDVQANTNAARDIEVNYTALARGACRSAVEKIRGWKTQGKLEAWQKEDEVLDAADARANTNNAVGAADYAAVDAGN